MLRSDLCDYSDANIVVEKRKAEVLILIAQEIKTQLSREILHLGHAYQKLITYSQIMQKILILICQCIIIFTILYSGNYSTTSASLWNYYRNEVNAAANENDAANNDEINNDKRTTNIRPI